MLLPVRGYHDEGAMVRKQLDIRGEGMETFMQAGGSCRTGEGEGAMEGDASYLQE